LKSFIIQTTIIGGDFNAAAILFINRVSKNEDLYGRTSGIGDGE